MAYFDEDAPEDKKLQGAPLTNLGCESRAAELGERLKFSGGSTKIGTVSNKAVVRANEYLNQPSFLNASEGEKKLLWKLGRGGAESKKAKEIVQQHAARVQQAKAIAVQNRKNSKLKKALRLNRLITECKKQGGLATPPPSRLRLVFPAPFSALPSLLSSPPPARLTPLGSGCRPVNLDNADEALKSLNQDQVLLEMAVLRALGADVKEKRKVTSGGASLYQIFFPREAKGNSLPGGKAKQRD